MTSFFHFLFKRLLYAIPVLFAVSSLTFLIEHQVPGGPFDSEKKLPPEILKNVEAKYGLNRPVTEQYLDYLKGLLQGDFGPSYKYAGRSVNDIIRDTLPVSIRLGLGAFAVSIGFGLLFGVLSARFRDSWIDRISLTVSSGGLSLPTFVLGSFLVFLFSIKLRWLPPALWEGWSYGVLPSLTLGIGSASYLARLIRTGLLEAESKDFVRTARASGIPEWKILLHILRHAAISVITVSGPLLAGLLTGSFIVEYLFSVPGMGRYFVTAVTNRDYPLIMGVTQIYALFIVLANIGVDLLYYGFDPRIERSED